MNEIVSASALEHACTRVDPRVGFWSLVDELSAAAQCTFVPGACTKGWYLPGGVVTANFERIADKLGPWCSQFESSFEAFVERIAEEDLRVTRYAVRTHYFIATIGDGPHDVLQVEVHELEEQIDRLLLDPCDPPTSLDQLLDPLEPIHLPHLALSPPHFEFVRGITMNHILDFIEPTSTLGRFFLDWSSSTAAKSERLERHWNIELGEASLPVTIQLQRARPIAVREQAIARLISRTEKLPLPRGTELARLLHDLDRDAGYPMAWYFGLVADKRVPARLALAVYEDLSHGFAYLPMRDAELLEQWVTQPYRTQDRVLH